MANEAAKSNLATIPTEPEVHPVAQVKLVFRRKPLAVKAEVVATSTVLPTSYGDRIAEAGDYLITEAGRTVLIPKADFPLLYETYSESSSVVDAGLPDMEPGSIIDHEGRRLVRVTVMSGRGTIAYWWDLKPRGADCAFRVVADLNDNPQASHRGGKFLEGFEGKPGTRAWVILP